ncbi:MAG TPA: DNA cytosine methyltransferase [Candidatus Saccharimonadales bacterium]|nr:DNA cytosine methyltransferase [Candidatus Saccharimonadales bacterium]
MKTATITEQEDINLDGVLDSMTIKPVKSSRKTKFTFIDLFAGIGGTRLGFESAGGKCVFTSEWDTFSQKTYEANFGDKPHGDITKIHTSDIPDFDVLLAGFPCQPFSSIGRRQGFEHATQGTLFYDVARIIKDKQPRAFMLENVPGLLTHDKGQTFEIIKKTLDEIGYTVGYKVLNSAEFGVPQQRKRIYIVGFRKELVADDFDFEFPVGMKKDVYINQFLERDAVGYSISKKLQDGYMRKLDDGRPMLVDHSTAVHVKTLVASYHKIQRLTGTFVSDGETGMRLFTESECKAIMGFPTDYKIPVSRTQMYRQFGNSIVVPVVSAVAKKMAKVLS